MYRELDRAKSLVKKHTKQDEDNTDEFEEDWTIVGEDEEVDISHPFEIREPITGIGQDASRTGGGALALGSMVLKGATASKRNSESAYRG